MRIACPHPIFRATMVVLAAAVCVIFAAAPAVAAPALRQAPQNPAFKLHGQALAAHAAVQGNGVAALGAASGLVPSPVDIGALSSSAPATRASGAGASWHRRAVTLTFKASDGKVGSSIARTEYRVDPVGAAAWQTGTSVMLPAPSDHFNDGVHTVEYRFVDNAGNTEATRTCSVKIDTLKPRPYANWAASVVRGHRARLRFYIGDPRPGSSRVTAVIKIRSLAASSGKTIVVHGSLNSSLSASFVCWLARGSYRFTISATDAAGNTQTAPASNRLTVHQGDG